MNYAIHRQHLRNSASTARHLTNELILGLTKTSREFDGVDDRLDRLVLLCEAMWELVKEETELTDDDLAAKFLERDESDGRRNFRRQRVAQPCSSCEAKVPPTRVRCQFCGESAVLASLFDLV